MIFKTKKIHLLLTFLISLYLITGSQIKSKTFLKQVDVAFARILASISSASSNVTSSDIDINKISNNTWTPSETLPGTRNFITLDGKNISFVIPNGWVYGWTNDRNAFHVRPNTTKFGDIMISKSPTSLQNPNASIKVLLEKVLQLMIQGIPHTPIVDPEEFIVNGSKAGRYIGRTTVNGVTMEGYAGLVIYGVDIYVVYGLYDANSANEFRLGDTTVLSTFRVLE
jgi:hypothetical protein